MKKLWMLLLVAFSITLIGCVEEAEPEMYEFAYNVGGGVIATTGLEQEVEHGKSIHEPSVSNTGFELVGWYSDSTYNILYDFTQPVYGNLTVYALWEEVVPDPIVCDAGYTLVEDLCVEDEPDPIVCDVGYVLVDEVCELEAVTVVLEVVFVPSRDASEILSAVAPLEQLLRDELFALGFEFDEVNITVSSSYEMGAESVATGNADVVFLPASTYIHYSDGLIPILAAARDSLNKDSENAADWNDGLATIMIPNSNDAAYYRSLIIAGQSTKGRELAAIINSGGALSWEDIEDANFCHGSETSSASYIYPNLWLMETFGKTMDDLTNGINAGGYGASIANIEAETCDVAAIYADGRMHNPFSSGDIFALTDVIAVSEPIANDGIFVGAHIDIKLAEALQIAFMNLINDSDNEDIFDIYSHNAYIPASFLLFEATRKVYDLEELLD